MILPCRPLSLHPPRCLVCHPACGARICKTVHSLNQHLCSCRQLCCADLQLFSAHHASQLCTAGCAHLHDSPSPRTACCTWQREGVKHAALSVPSCWIICLLLLTRNVCGSHALAVLAAAAWDSPALSICCFAQRSSAAVLQACAVFTASRIPACVPSRRALCPCYNPALACPRAACSLG